MKVVVIGAGIAGLAAGTYAARDGHEVIVLEASDRVGGRARTLRHRGDTVDVGTQYYHSNYRRTLELLKDVGLKDALDPIGGATRFFDSRAKRGSFRVGHRLPWFETAGVGGNLRLWWNVAKLLLTHRTDPYTLDGPVPASDGKRALEVFRDRNTVEYMIRTLTVAGAITEPEPTDVSVLHIARLLRIIVLTRYYSCREGNAALHERLAERLDVRLETPVGRVLMEGSRVTGVELVSGEAVKADHVIVCTPPPATAAMLPDDWTEELDFLRSIRIPTFAFPTLFLDRPLQPGIWSYMMPWRQGTLTSCVLDAHRKNPHMVPSGKAILQPWPAYPAWERLSGMDDDAITAAVLEELGRFWEGIEGWVEHVEVTRHAVAVPFHPAGHHAAAKKFMASADAREGVSFCGDYLSGGYVEPAVWTAERAVSRLGS